MNPEQSQKNANQIWVDLACAQVDKLFAVAPPIANMNQQKIIAWFTNQRNKVCELLTNYSNTRWRVFVDEIIQFLEIVKKERERVDAEYAACWGIRFKKKRILYNQAISLKSQQDAYQNALLVLINTLPPTPGPQEVVEPVMKVDKTHVNGSAHVSEN